jgi:hypothetical protein
VLLYVNDQLNKDKLHFELRSSSVVAFRILENVVINFLLSVLVSCEMKLLSKPQWDPQRLVAAVISSGINLSCRRRVKIVPVLN